MGHNDQAGAEGGMFALDLLEKRIATRVDNATRNVVWNPSQATTSWGPLDADRKKTSPAANRLFINENEKGIMKRRSGRWEGEPKHGFART